MAGCHLQVWPRLLSIAARSMQQRLGYAKLHHVVSQARPYQRSREGRVVVLCSLLQPVSSSPTALAAQNERVGGEFAP